MAGLPACPTARPNDDDLTGVVTHLAPLTTRRGVVHRDPNEPEVRWLLEAGIRAMCEGMLDRSAESSGPMAYSHANGLFDTLPVESVMRCFRDMCAEQGIDPGSANKARLIRRWSFAANYQLDLMAYVFRPALLEASITEAEDAIRAAWDHLTLGEIVDAFSVPRSDFSPLDSIFRIQHVFQLMFPRDASIRRFCGELHAIQARRWGRFYDSIGDACGLTAHGMTHGDMAVVTRLIAETGMLQSASTGEPLTLEDGTPLVVGTIRAILTSVYGLPWEELAARRPVRPPERDPDAPARTPIAGPVTPTVVSDPGPRSAA